ncbi:MAG: phytanoyl-CoA hydroxylase [Candidatus Promineifilaceae bacterium]|jgi:phytanoyl-CoA hydroxylase
MRRFRKRCFSEGARCLTRIGLEDISEILAAREAACERDVGDAGVAFDQLFACRFDSNAIKEAHRAVAHEFFSESEVAAIQAEVERLKTEGHNVATLADGETPSGAAVNLQIIPLGPKSELLRTLPFLKKVRAVITQLIGDDALLQLDQVFVKPPRHGSGTSWHQGNACFGIPNPTQGVGMWVAVHDANVANGTMHVVPRSHREALTHTRDTGSDHHICCQIDETIHEVVPVEMKAGGALFFNYGVAHCTLANNTGKERAGMALHFLKGAYRD